MSIKISNDFISRVTLFASILILCSQTGVVVMKNLQVALNFRQYANERPSFWSTIVTLWREAKFLVQ